jgi:hypothetical protein
MKNISSAAAAVAACLALIPGLANADQNTARIDQIPGAPITVDGCVVQINQDMVAVPEFTNTSDRTIDAVELKILIFDAFDTRIDTERVQKAGTFSPGVGIRVKRLFGTPIDYSDLDTSSNAAKTTCSVDKVRFDDGSLWTAPGEAPG